MSYLSFYKNHFGDDTAKTLEIVPFKDFPKEREHLEAHSDDMKSQIIELIERGEKVDIFAHPCWCNPELIYRDDVRGNEVWLHKRCQ